MKKKGHKVVFQSSVGSRDISTSAWYLGEQAVVYEVGKWTYPREDCGPLAVFTDLQSAEEFRQSLSRNIAPLGNQFKLWECDYYQANEQSLWIPTRLCVDAPHGTWPHYLEVKKSHCPKNTDFAYQIKLTKEIK